MSGHEAIPAPLRELIAGFEDAEPDDRISHRDGILAFGGLAIPALVESTSRNPGLGASVAAWLGELARRDPTMKSQVHVALRQIRTESTKALVDQIIGSPAQTAGATQPRDPFAVDDLPEGAGYGWPGFREDDFRGIRGTTWRQRDGRTSLAPRLVRALRYRHPHVMSFGVQRSPELHLALTDRYRLGDEAESGWRAAKLVVYAHGPTESNPAAPPEVVAGLYVEKGSLADARRFGIVDERSWDWPWLLKALRDEHATNELIRAMVRHGLQIGDYVGGRIRSASDRVGFVAGPEDGELLVRASDGKVENGFESVASRLEAQPEDAWRSVHVWRTWEADEALAAGPSFADDALLPVTNDLFDFYLDMIGPTLEPR